MIRKKLENIIRAVLEEPEITFDENVDLQSLGIDSIKFIQIIIFIEDTFGVEIPDEYLLFSKLDTFEKIEVVLKNLSLE